MPDEQSPATPLLSSTLVRAVVALALVVVILGAVLLLRGGDGDAGGTAVTETPAAEVTPYTSDVYTVCGDEGDVALAAAGPPVVGEPAPDFALCDAEGQFVRRVSDMQGQVVWLNFWATWCVPCKKELPDIQALYDELQDDGLEVLIVNYRESAEEALEFLPPLGISMPVVLDQGGSVYDEYRLAGLPDSFFIDREGVLAAVYYGFVNEEIARERLAMAGLEAAP
jgi:thiol-disulfide isomerase/thioredoxin